MEPTVNAEASVDIVGGAIDHGGTDDGNNDGHINDGNAWEYHTTVASINHDGHVKLFYMQHALWEDDVKWGG